MSTLINLAKENSVKFIEIWVPVPSKELDAETKMLLPTTIWRNDEGPFQGCPSQSKSFPFYAHIPRGKGLDCNARLSCNFADFNPPADADGAVLLSPTNFRTGTSSQTQHTLAVHLDVH